jgi:hypothetical protein
MQRIWNSGEAISGRLFQDSIHARDLKERSNLMMNCSQIIAAPDDVTPSKLPSKVRFTKAIDKFRCT